jgi:[ribosomal protein S5]-alanine N-acetyltransferase
LLVERHMSSIRPPEYLETERLTLRAPLPSDAPEMFERYCQDAAVARFLCWRPHTNVSETQQFVARCIGQWEVRASFNWLILDKRDHRLMGNIELEIDGWRGTLGYVLARDVWGRNYMTEAVRGLAAWALAQPQIHRIGAWSDIDNIASCRVLEKVGFQREGLMKRWSLHPNISDVPRDCYVYGRIK